MQQLTLRNLLFSIVLLLSSAAMAAPLTPAEVSAGWLNLTDGTLYGWNPTGVWGSQASILSAAPGADRKLMYALPIADFELRFMFRVTQAKTGAALRLRTGGESAPADNGFRVSLADGDPSWPAGSIVNRVKSTLSLSVGQWHIVSVDASGGRVTVKIDGQQTASTADTGSKAGYFGFESKQDAGLDLRDIHLLPKSMEKIFNGSDLSGWKDVPFTKPASGGAFHPVEKIFGGGGGGKPHSAKWTVNGGRIVGEKGPGALETSAQYQDFVLQMTASSQTKKKDGFPAVYVRNDAGKMFTGYAIGIGPKLGQVQGLGQPRHPFVAKDESTQTVLAFNRQIGIFVDGQLVTLATDTRPEGNSEKLGARSTGGVISLAKLEEDGNVSFRNLAVQQIPRALGGTVRVEAASVPAVSGVPADGAGAKVDTLSESAKLAAALGVMDPKQKAEVASLMSSAVRSNDPQRQMDLYDQIIRIDPTNAPAVQGYKEAQGKLEAQQKSHAAEEQKQQTDVTTQESTQAQLAAAQSSAQTSFLAGHLRDADRDLALAERLGPGDPVTRALRSRISSAYSLRSRLMYLGSGAGLVSVMGLFWLWRSRRKEQRSPVLEMTRGLEEGRLFPIDKDVIKIGAVRQDGGQKNDIVVEDVEHMISRFHCEVQRKNGAFFLVDSGSSNGTSVNGKKADSRTPISIKKGTRINLAGTVEFRFGYDRRPKA